MCVMPGLINIHVVDVGIDTAGPNPRINSMYYCVSRTDSIGSTFSSGSESPSEAEKLLLVEIVCYTQGWQKQSHTVWCIDDWGCFTTPASSNDQHNLARIPEEIGWDWRKHLPLDKLVIKLMLCIEATTTLVNKSGCVECRSKKMGRRFGRIILE